MSQSLDELAKTLWDYNCLYQPLEKADCIMVWGSNDLRVAHRGAELYLQGYAPLMIFSGGFGRNTKDEWSKTEAESFADEAIRMGVPKEKILIENQATNTGENIELSKKLLQEKGVKVNKVMLVQKPYMQRKSLATFNKRWPEVELIVTAPDISYEDYPNESISKDHLINMMVGDTQRIKLYAERGFQVSQVIPTAVWSAYQELVKRGYDKQLVKDL